MTDLDKAKELIKTFCEEEYGSEADFSNLRKVDIAYTEHEDGTKVQASCDLIYNSLTIYVNGEEKEKFKYKTLAGLIKCQLYWLNFENLTAY